MKVIVTPRIIKMITIEGRRNKEKNEIIILIMIIAYLFDTQLIRTGKEIKKTRKKGGFEKRIKRDKHSDAKSCGNTSAYR